MKLSIIIVSFNTKDILINCINSIFSSCVPAPYEVIVVDNASSDGTVTSLGQIFHQGLVIIANAQNYGFSKANNQGIQVSKGDVLFFLNPDTIVLEDSIARLLNSLEVLKAGIVGPKLYRNFQLEYHPSIRKFTKPFYIFLSFLPLSGQIVDFYNKYLLNKELLREVDWLWGAALMVRREVILRIGGFDEDYFMYSEEEDFCLRAKRAGFKIYYFPKAHIIHLGGQSSKMVASRSLIYFWQSKIRFLNKYFRPVTVRIFKFYFKILLSVKCVFDRSHRDVFQTIVKVMESE